MAWVLAISILMHPLFSYLATPLVQSHENGEWSVVCTLQGAQKVFIDFDSGQAGDPAHCPALKLLQMVATGSVSLSPVAPMRVLYASSIVGQWSGYPYRTRHFSVFSSRAPPLV